MSEARLVRFLVSAAAGFGAAVRGGFLFGGHDEAPPFGWRSYLFCPGLPLRQPGQNFHVSEVISLFFTINPFVQGEYRLYRIGQLSALP